MTKKALIFNPYWNTLGGGERYSASVAEYLQKQGWQVDIYWSNNLNTLIKNRFQIDISHVNYVNSDWTYKYDLVFWVSDGSLPASFAKKTIVHFQFPFKLKPNLSNSVKSRFYTLVCNSNFTKKFIDQSFQVNSLVLYPPIDTSLFPPLKKTNSILYVGRFSSLTQNKNQLQLIKSFQKINLPGWKLTIAGGLGIGRDEKFINLLKKQIKNSNIELIFNPDLKSLKKLYGQAKLFWGAAGFGIDENIDPTKVEHFGISVVESMAAGSVPLICNAGGYKEILTFTSGFLWDTPAEMEYLTIQLAKNAKLLNYMSKQAQLRSKIFDKACFQNSLASIVG